MKLDFFSGACSLAPHLVNRIAERPAVRAALQDESLVTEAAAA